MEKAWARTSGDLPGLGQHLLLEGSESALHWRPSDDSAPSPKATRLVKCNRGTWPRRGGGEASSRGRIRKEAGNTPHDSACTLEVSIYLNSVQNPAPPASCDLSHSQRVAMGGRPVPTTPRSTARARIHQLYCKCSDDRYHISYFPVTCGHRAAPGNDLIKICQRRAEYPKRPAYWVRSVVGGSRLPRLSGVSSPQLFSALCPVTSNQ